MTVCAECGGKKSFTGEIAHKRNCSQRPKSVVTRCDECGGPKTIRGFQHLPTCSNNPVPRVEDYLLRSIGVVGALGLEGVLPLRSYSPANPPVPSGEVLLKSPAAVDPQVAPVSDKMTERLLTALASISNADIKAARAVTDPTTIRSFRGMDEGQQFAFINRLWGSISSSHAFNTPGNQMSDPAGDDMTGPTLPSSVCPTSPGTSVYKKRLSGRQPFREFGIGFRVDGSDKSSIARVLSQGMTQQRLNAGFILGPHRGLRLDGTVMMDQTQARCWSGNNDIFNETAVCVSRNFFGGTAFPERTTNGTCYLWAVDCSDLLGFDTEGYQLGLPNSRQWRPGEKAFPSIPVANLMGYIEIDRRGAPAEGGWRVNVDTTAAWTFTGAPSVKQRKYLEDELAAWRGGRYTIPPEYDFAT